MTWDRYPSIEFVPGALLLVDPQGRIAEINQEASALFGYVREELIGQPAESLFAAEHRDMYLCRLSDTLSMRESGPVVSTMDLAGRRRDGTGLPATVLQTAAVVGNSCHALNLFATPCDQLQTTEDLLKALTLFMSLHCASMEGFIVLGEEGMIQHCNQIFCGLLGYGHDELCGLDILDVETVEESGTTKRFLNQIALNEWRRVQTRFRRKNTVGTLLEINLGRFPTTSGSCFLGFVHHDFSGYPAAGLHTAALTAVTRAVMITDRDGRILWANPAFSKLTGFETAEYFARSARLLASGRHPKSYYEEMWQTILKGDVWQGEIINRRKDGDLYTEEMTITPFRAQGHEITHFVAFKQEVSAEPKAKRILQQGGRSDTPN